MHDTRSRTGSCEIVLFGRKTDDVFLLFFFHCNRRARQSFRIEPLNSYSLPLLVHARKRFTDRTDVFNEPFARRSTSNKQLDETSMMESVTELQTDVYLIK